MNTLHLLLLAAATFGGALAATFVCQWRTARALSALQARLDKSEQARQAALERSDQARTQIGQLSKALADLQQAHKRQTAEARLAAAAPAPAPSGSEPVTLVLPRRELPQAFADTQVM